MEKQQCRKARKSGCAVIRLRGKNGFAYQSSASAGGGFFCAAAQNGGVDRRRQGIYRRALKVRFSIRTTLRAHCRQWVREAEISSGFSIDRIFTLSFFWGAAPILWSAPPKPKKLDANVLSNFGN
jgi:hypothetical protein